MDIFENGVKTLTNLVNPVIRRQVSSYFIATVLFKFNNFSIVFSLKTKHIKCVFLPHEIYFEISKWLLLKLFWLA